MEKLQTAKAELENLQKTLADLLQELKEVVIEKFSFKYFNFT